MTEPNVAQWISGLFGRSTPDPLPGTAEPAAPDDEEPARAWVRKLFADDDEMTRTRP